MQKAELAASQQPQGLALVSPRWAQVSEFIEWVFNRKPACRSVLSGGTCSSTAEPSPCSSRAAGSRLQRLSRSQCLWIRKSSSLEVFHLSQTALLSSTNLEDTEMALRVMFVLSASSLGSLGRQCNSSDPGACCGCFDQQRE